MRLALERFLEDKPYSLADVAKELHDVNPSRGKRTIYNYTRTLRPQRKSRLSENPKQPSLEMLSEILEAVQRLNSRHGGGPVTPNDLLDLSDNAFVRLDFPGASWSLTIDSLPQALNALNRDTGLGKEDRTVFLAMARNQMGWEEEPAPLLGALSGVETGGQGLLKEYVLDLPTINDAHLGGIATRIAWRLEIATAYRHYGRLSWALGNAKNALHLVSDLLNKTGAYVLPSKETPGTRTLKALEAGALYAIGASARMLGRLDLAAEYARDAEAGALAVGAHATAGKAGVELALLAIDNDRPSEALARLKGLFGHLPAVGEHRTAAYAHVAAAEAYFAIAYKGRYTRTVIEEGEQRERAIDHLSQAEEVFAQLHDARGLALSDVIRAMICTLPAARKNIDHASGHMNPATPDSDGEGERSARTINKYDLYLHMRDQWAMAIRAAVEGDGEREKLNLQEMIRLQATMAATEEELDADAVGVAQLDAFHTNLARFRSAELHSNEKQCREASDILDSLLDSSTRHITDGLRARAQLRLLHCRRVLAKEEKMPGALEELWTLHYQTLRSLQAQGDENGQAHAHLEAFKLHGYADESLRRQLQEAASAQELFEKLEDWEGLAEVHKLVATRIALGPYPFNLLPLDPLDTAQQGRVYQFVKFQGEEEVLLKTVSRTHVPNPEVSPSASLGTEEVDDLYRQLVEQAVVPRFKLASRYLYLLGSERHRFSSLTAALRAVEYLIDAKSYDAALTEAESLVERAWGESKRFALPIAKAHLYQARIHWAVHSNAQAALALYDRATDVLEVLNGKEGTSFELARKVAEELVAGKGLDEPSHQRLVTWLRSR